MVVSVRRSSLVQLGSVTLALLLVSAACSSDRSGSGDASSADGNDETVTSGSIATESDLPEALQEEFSTALTDVMDRYQVPGAVIALATPDGSWSAEAGVADLDARDPVSSEMVWPLRSLTKSFTVTVLLQLVDEGALNLDDTIDQYIEGVPDGDTMTLRQLADMSSGVGDYTRSEPFLDDLIGDPTRQFTLEELNEYGLAEGAQFAPGSDRVYSNTAPNILAVVIETVTGQPIGDVIHTRIVEELDLARTGYPTSDDEWAEPHAQGYQPSGGDLEPMFNNFSSMGASGAMISTLADMTVWAEALGSGSLISPEAQAERLVGSPLSEGPEYDVYALGIGEVEGWWGHSGEGLGFTALAMYDPQSGSTAAVFMNISQAAGMSASGEEEERHAPTALMREIARILAGS